MSTTVLNLDHVIKDYPGTPPVRAIDDVSLRVNEGDSVAIVGPSGSGKSTLLNLMGALDRPTNGVVSLNGKDIAGLPDRELSALRGTSIGFVFQRFMLIDALDSVQNVATSLLYRGVTKAQRTQLAIDALKRVGLEHRLEHRPSRMSGGEQQRVAIARAIVGKPALILADEPTGNLDSKNGEEILALLLDLNAAGHTLVAITHDPKIAAHLGRQVHLQDRRIINDSDWTMAK